MISVIIPVYNVEKYIEACILSVCNQTFKEEYEVLIVDDCGQDKSIAIAEHVLKNNGQVQYQILHHDYNRGLSAARNTGLDAANGEYVYFLDSDDLISPNCLECLWSLSQEHPDAEMIVGQYDEFEEGKPTHEARWKQQGGIYDKDVIGVYLEEKIPVTAWNKLVRKTFLNNNKLFFEEGLVHEDALWSFQCACLMKKVVVSDEVTYHYLQRSGSLDKQQSSKLHFTHYSHAYCLQSKFVFEQGLQKDKRLFHFIEKRRYQLLTDACTIDSNFAFVLYKETREYPYWKQWHRFLPAKIAFGFYIKLRCWYLKMYSYERNKI